MREGEGVWNDGVSVMPLHIHLAHTWGSAVLSELDVQLGTHTLASGNSLLQKKFD